jgi:hypothetical protein
MSNKVAAVVIKIVEQLEQLDSSEDRRRAVDAALTVLGDVEIAKSPAKQSSHEQATNGLDRASDRVSDRGAAWIKQHGISEEMLERVFDIEDGKVELIGESIGKSKREGTINTYLLTGIAALLGKGKSEFSDEVARAYCEHLGCYDSANHAKYLKEGFGNKMTGSKTQGWKLTGPGMAAAAALLRPAKERDK